MELKALLVDDDKNIRTMLSVGMKDFGWTVTLSASAEEAIRELEAQRFDLVLTDFRMEGKNGLELLREIRASQPEALTVLMTAFASFENAVTAIKEGAYDYLPKPFTNVQLKHLLKKAQTLVSLKRENERLKRARYRSDYFTGLTSPASLRLEEFVRKVIPSAGCVLLVGESGTGKTELARLIHSQSARAVGPFVPIDCLSIRSTQEIADAHSRAEGGTLFLDEVSSLPDSAQTALLQCIEEGTDVRAIKCRIVAASRASLREAVLEGAFKENLYYRLNAFECDLVSLRYRKEDIPVLLRKFLREFAEREHVAEKSLSDDLQGLLQAYDWPGNVREFRNTIERVLLLSAGRPARLDDLPEAVRNDGVASSVQQNRTQTLDEVEREHIRAVLATERSLERAAEVLGITTVTLWRKRKEYGLP